MRTQTLILALACAQIFLACDSTESGLKPVGGEQVLPAEVERFVRRAHLDMVAKAATDDFVSEKRDAIIAGGNTAAVRAEVATELIATPEWATAFAEELEQRTFAGDGYDFAYNFLCGQARGNPGCSDCTANQDPCQGCTCTQVTTLLEERTGLENIGADLASGDATTGEVERRVAASQGYRFGRSIPGLATNLFEHFLDRVAEADELANASALIVGFVAAQGNAAGLLFHRHGSNYVDLIDILFTSELYREAVVSRTFERLLGREPSPAEIAHFIKDLDPDAVSSVDVTNAIVSSGEYFNQ